MTHSTRSWRLAGVALCLAAGVSSIAAQGSSDVQALRKEIETLKQRVDALQAEVTALKTPARPAADLSKIALRIDRAQTRGNAQARVVFVEMSDFECPFCSRYYRSTAPVIDRDYVDTGKVRHAFVHFPLATHPNALRAANAAACAAAQGRFWQMRDRLFSNQTQLAGPMLPVLAGAVGVHVDQFTLCLERESFAADIRSDLAMGTAAGVTATPTFFIATVDPKTQALTVVSRIVGAKAYSVFQEALNAALARP